MYRRVHDRGVPRWSDVVSGEVLDDPTACCAGSDADRKIGTAVPVELVDAAEHRQTSHSGPVQGAVIVDNSECAVTARIFYCGGHFAGESACADKNQMIHDSFTVLS